MEGLHIVGWCFFCEKPMIGKETIVTKEEREELGLIFGFQPNRLGGER